MIIDAHYGKALMFIGATFREKLLSHHQAVSIDCWIRLSLSRLFLTLSWICRLSWCASWYLLGLHFERSLPIIEQWVSRIRQNQTAVSESNQTAVSESNSYLLMRSVGSKTFEFMNAVSDTIWDIINAAYHCKLQIFYLVRLFLFMSQFQSHSFLLHASYI